MGLLSVYFVDGRVFEYEVKDSTTARAHMDKIYKNGYRSTASGDLDHYGPHYIDKIKYAPSDPFEVLTKYPDRVRGT